jgi:biopolymer transport protein TolQ
MNADNFSIFAAVLHADWVVRLVMIGLALASLWSWAIIIDKAFRFTALNREADKFEDQVASGHSLEDVAQAAGEAPRHALPRMLQAALREWREARRVGLNDLQTTLLIQRVDRSLDSTIARESGRVEEGLFGTVWGIMNAFQAIAIQKNTNLTVVAPAISQALFATAVGLAAAIPAYIAYNKFTTDASKFTARLEAFADDLAAAVARRLGGAA